MGTFDDEDADEAAAAAAAAKKIQVKVRGKRVLDDSDDEDESGASAAASAPASEVAASTAVSKSPAKKASGDAASSSAFTKAVSSPSPQSKGKAAKRSVIEVDEDEDARLTGGARGRASKAAVAAAKLKSEDADAAAKGSKKSGAKRKSGGAAHSDDDEAPQADDLVVNAGAKTKSKSAAAAAAASADGGDDAMAVGFVGDEEQSDDGEADGDDQDDANASGEPKAKKPRKPRAKKYDFDAVEKKAAFFRCVMFLGFSSMYLLMILSLSGAKVHSCLSQVFHAPSVRLLSGQRSRRGRGAGRAAQTHGGDHAAVHGRGRLHGDGEGDGRGARQWRGRCCVLVVGRLGLVVVLGVSVVGDGRGGRGTKEIASGIQGSGTGGGGGGQARQGAVWYHEFLWQKVSDSRGHPCHRFAGIRPIGNTFWNAMRVSDDKCVYAWQFGRKNMLVAQQKCEGTGSVEWWTIACSPHI